MRDCACGRGGSAAEGPAAGAAAAGHCGPQAESGIAGAMLVDAGMQQMCRIQSSQEQDYALGIVAPGKVIVNNNGTAAVCGACLTLQPCPVPIWSHHAHGINARHCNLDWELQMNKEGKNLSA